MLKTPRISILTFRHRSSCMALDIPLRNDALFIPPPGRPVIKINGDFAMSIEDSGIQSYLLVKGGPNRHSISGSSTPFTLLERLILATRNVAVPQHIGARCPSAVTVGFAIAMTLMGQVPGGTTPPLESAPLVAQPADVLALDQSVAHSLSCPEEVRTYDVTVALGEFASIRIDRTETLAEIRLISPSKKEVMRLWFPGKYRGSDDLTFVAAEGGRHQIEIRCGRDWYMGLESFTPDSKGSVTVTLREVRVATANDQRRFEAIRDLYDSLKVLRSSSRVALERAKVASASARMTLSTLGDDAAVGFGFHVEGLLAYAEVENARALDLFKSSALAYGSLDKIRDLDHSLTLHRGLVNSSMRNYEAALEFYDRVIAEAQQANDRLTHGATLHWTAWAKIQEQDTKSQIAAVEQASSLFHAARSHRWHIRTNLQYYFPANADDRAPKLASLLQLSGQLPYLRSDRVLVLLRTPGRDRDERLGLLMSALDLARELRSKDLEWTALYYLGYSSPGARGLDFYRQAWLLTDAVDESKEERKASTAAMICARMRDSFAEAIPTCELALKYAKDTYDLNSMVSAESALGLLYSNSGHPENGISHLRTALRLARVDGNLSLQFGLLKRIAGIQIRVGQLDEALISATTLVALPGFEVSALNLLAEVQISRSALPEAQDALQRASGKSPSTINLETQYLSALVAEKKGDFGEVRRLMQPALLSMEGQRQGLPLEDLLRLGANTRQHHDIFIKALLETSLTHNVGSTEIQATFEALERARARVFLESLVKQVGSAGMVSKSLFDLRESVKKVRAERRREQVDLLVKGLRGAERWRLLEEEIARSDVKLAEIDREIRSAEVAYTGPTANLEQLQGALADDEVFLDYAVIGGELNLWLVSKSSIYFRRLGESKRLYNLGDQLWRSLDGRNVATMSATSPTSSVYQELGDLLLGEVLPRIRGKRAFIAADLFFKSIPFGALFVKGQDGSLRPFVAECEIVHVPSASALVRMRTSRRPRDKARNSIALIGDPVFDVTDLRIGAEVNPILSRRENVPDFMRPLADLHLDRAATVNGAKVSFVRLPFARAEVNRIASLFEGIQDVLKATDFQANLEFVNRLRHSDFKILHFATHGILDWSPSDLSGLVFSLVDRTGRAQSGYLTSADVLGWDVRADVVVLSACDTARGRSYPSEGVIGLTEAFLIAGASSVVSSLWKVDDAATAELMYKFYRHMVDGKKSPPAALRAAQLEMLKQPAYSDPYVWAAFVIQGAGPF